MNRDLKGQRVYLVVFMLTLIALCITVVINFQPLYYFFVDHHHLANNVGLSRPELVKNYQHLLNYLNFPWVTSLHMSLPSSADGLTHFADVKHLFLLNYAILIVGAPFSWVYLKTLKQHNTLWKLIAPAQMVLTGVILLVIIMLLSFQQFFITFHEVLFRNQDWVFDAVKDPIINALPDNFFLACFIMFFSLFCAALISMIVIGKRSLSK